MNSLAYSSNILNNSFALYGYIYVNFYSNFILLVPITIYYIYKKIKERKFFSFDIIFFIFLLIFMGILGVGVYFERVSVYFLMKNYYIFWLIMIYMNFKGLMDIFDTNKPKVYAIIFFYIFLIILNFIFVKAPLGKGPLNDNESITNFVEIFGVNKTIIKDRQIDLNQDEIDIIKYAKENIDFSKEKVEVMGNSEQLYWTYSFLNYVNHDNFFENPKYNGQNKLTLKAMRAYQKIGIVDYMIYFNRSKYYEQAEDEVFLNGEIIYKNDAGGIIKY